MKKYPAKGAGGRARALRREMTEAETALGWMLRYRQVEGFRFRRQAPIGRFIADFVCHEARLMVEIDGGQHDLAAEPETARTRFLEGEGCRVPWFWNNEVLANPEGAPRSSRNCGELTPTPTLPHQGGV